MEMYQIHVTTEPEDIIVEAGSMREAVAAAEDKADEVLFARKYTVTQISPDNTQVSFTEVNL